MEIDDEDERMSDEGDKSEDEDEDEEPLEEGCVVVEDSTMRSLAEDEVFAYRPWMRVQVDLIRP